MNKIKGVLVLACIFAVCVSCFGTDVMIKRKKNKWISFVEQPAMPVFNSSQPAAV